MKTNIIKQHVQQGLLRMENHPFILMAQSNTLKKEQVLSWIMCAGRESRTFPEILKNMIAWEKNNVISSILQDNFDDECGNGNPQNAHFKHYLELIQKVGLTQQDFLEYNEKEGIKLATSLAYNISMSKSSGRTIGYMLINEAITPITYSAVKNACMQFFPGLDTNFFDIHIEVDDHHVAELYNAIESLEVSELEEVLFGIEIGERGMAVLLDEAIGIYNVCDSIPPFSLELDFHE